MRIDHIPVKGGEPPTGAEPSRVRPLIRELRPSRRTALKSLAVGAVTAALVPLEWVFTKGMALAGPTSEWTGAGCADSYPNGYTQQANNWWSSGAATCFGGWRRGSYPCASGWHFEGWRGYSDEGYTSNRIATACGSGGTKKNAWRWTTSGLVYRCSDATTTCVWNSGERYTALTIAMCRV
ncbi:hypothetical protein [Streptosporangium sp. CA-115845]|uniref:hypothetical protein n=1 Tax=Streptosporangium sp. CA-115845 TaxID=3240071 RepID=UPI003D91AD21